MSVQKHIVIDARVRRASTGRPVDRLLMYLQTLDRDNKYTILLEPDDGWRPNQPNFNVRYVGIGQFSFNPWQQLSYSLLLYKLKADLVFFTLTAQQPIFYYGRQITLTHDLTMLEYARAGRLPKWLHALRMVGYRMLFRSGNRKAKHIIVPSQYVADDLARHYPFTTNKINVVYEASEPPITEPSSPLAGVTKPFIFHIGSPFPHKNIERLVLAFEQLAQIHDNLLLILPGKKEFYFSQLQKQIDDSPVRDKIIVPGFVSEAERKWLYENAEAYVLPSLSEGFGLPGLEAMAHGTPLVSSSATCLPEVYGEAAHYFDPTSLDDMVRAINEVLSDKQLRQTLVKKGYEQLKKYSWQRMAEQTLDVIDKSL